MRRVREKEKTRQRKGRKAMLGNVGVNKYAAFPPGFPQAVAEKKSLGTNPPTVYQAKALY
jgi:hypothetical protein